MAYDFSKFKKRAQDIKDWLQAEYTGIRTGRATPALLDSVMVESYGARVPIKHVAAISVEDARTMRIAPWDKSQIKGVEQAIAASNLGIGTAPDGESIRVTFPMLSTERRTQLIKLSKEKLEEARVSIRNEREIAISEIQAKEKDGSMSEDERFRAKNELQKLVDQCNLDLEALAEKKNAEIQE